MSKISVSLVNLSVIGLLVATGWILATGRRGKYLLIHFEHGTLIIHLGMSGHLRVLPPGIEPRKHDHFDLVVNGPEGVQVLRLTDWPGWVETAEQMSP